MEPVKRRGNIDKMWNYARKTRESSRNLCTRT